MQLNKQLIMALGLAFSVIQTHATDDLKEYKIQERELAKWKVKAQFDSDLADVSDLTPEERQQAQDQFNEIKETWLKAYDLGIQSDEAGAKGNHLESFKLYLASMVAVIKGFLLYPDTVCLKKLNTSEENLDNKAQKESQKLAQYRFEQLTPEERVQALALIEKNKNLMAELVKSRCATMNSADQSACTEKGEKHINKGLEDYVNILTKISNKA